MQVPVLDFSSVGPLGETLAPTAEFETLCRDVDDALTNIGFMSATNLGIDMSLLDEVFEASHQFFTSAFELKQRSAYLSAAENFGYQGLQQENLDPSSPADLKETFTMRDLVNKPPTDDRWPSPEFRELMNRFYANCFAGALKLQEVTALALGLPQDFFTQVHGGENVTLRLLYYPASGVPTVQEGQMGAGAHTDYGLLTLLFQRGVSGLEVLDHNGEWIPIEPRDGTVVVNSGDLLERWTNGRYRSTVHRVRPKIGGQERMSIAMFLDPDSATQVEVLDSCVSEGNPARYPTVTAGQHLQEKIEASHKNRLKAQGDGSASSR